MSRFRFESIFHIIFKTYKGKKQLEISLRKNPDNYETIRDYTSVFEQKAVKVDDFKKQSEKFRKPSKKFSDTIFKM